MRIGFVDHYLNNFHSTKFLTLLRGPLAGRGTEVVAAWESEPRGEDWCEKNNIPRAESARAVAEGCDAVMVLAPNTIEAHLDLCREVFPARKPTLVDKLLAPDVSTAKQVFGLAEQYGVRLFSSSALRFAEELTDILPAPGVTPAGLFARGMGEWEHYGMHTVSLAMAICQEPVCRIINTGSGQAAVVTVEYAGGDRALIEVRSAANQWEAFPWLIGFQNGENCVTRTIKDFDAFYSNLMEHALDFFETGKSPISEAEILRVVSIMEGASRSREAGGVWIELPG